MSNAFALRFLSWRRTLQDLLQNLAGFVVYCSKICGKSRLAGNVKWGLRSGMPYGVMPPPSSGADPDELVECARERCLIIKSRLNRDLDQRHAGLIHQLFGLVDAMLRQPLVSRGTERGFE